MYIFFISFFPLEVKSESILPWSPLAVPLTYSASISPLTTQTISDKQKHLAWWRHHFLLPVGLASLRPNKKFITEGSTSELSLIIHQWEIKRGLDTASDLNNGDNTSAQQSAPPVTHFQALQRPTWRRRGPLNCRQVASPGAPHSEPIRCSH